MMSHSMALRLARLIFLAISHHPAAALAPATYSTTSIVPSYNGTACNLCIPDPGPRTYPGPIYNGQPCTQCLPADPNAASRTGASPPQFNGQPCPTCVPNPVTTVPIPPVAPAFSYPPGLSPPTNITPLQPYDPTAPAPVVGGGS